MLQNLTKGMRFLCLANLHNSKLCCASFCAHSDLSFKYYCEFLSISKSRIWQPRDFLSLYLRLVFGVSRSVFDELNYLLLRIVLPQFAETPEVREQLQHNPTLFCNCRGEACLKQRKNCSISYREHRCGTQLLKLNLTSCVTAAKTAFITSNVHKRLYYDTYSYKHKRLYCVTFHIDTNGLIRHIDINCFADRKKTTLPRWTWTKYPDNHWFFKRRFWDYLFGETQNVKRLPDNWNTLCDVIKPLTASHSLFKELITECNATTTFTTSLCSLTERVWKFLTKSLMFCR